MLDESLLKKHLVFEFTESGFNEKTGLLLEMYGAVTNIRYYLDIVEKKFLESEDMEVNLTDGDFPLGTVKNIKISISFRENPSIRSTVRGKQTYKQGISTITIDVQSYDKKSAVPKIRKVIGHEMIHILHEKGLRNVYGDDVNFDDFEKFYKGAVYFLENGDALEKEFGSILYFLADSEKNAFIGQVFTELEDYKDTIINDKTAKQAIMKTETYNRLDKLYERIKKLKKYPKAEQLYLVTAFNRFTGLNYTFERMLKWMDFRFNSFLNKFFEQASKMANFYYQENVRGDGRLEKF